MKPVLYSLAVMGLAFSGCRSTEEDVQANGSYPDLKTGNVSEGELIVEPITAKSPLPKGQPAALYSVYDEQGKRIAQATTSSMTLAAGRYLVRLEQPDPDVKPFWVTVERGKTTHVDLTKIKEGEVPATVD